MNIFTQINVDYYDKKNIIGIYRVIFY